MVNSQPTAECDWSEQGTRERPPWADVGGEHPCVWRAEWWAYGWAHGGLARCSEKRLVEVFDIEPVGGPQKASEGYIWVGECDVPQSGKK